MVSQTNSKRPGYKLVGASLPPRVHNYLSIYCAAKSKSKSQIIKDLLENWIQSQKTQHPAPKLIIETIERLNAAWKWGKASGKITDFDQFVKETSKELKYKGLKKSEIEHIINELRR